MDDMTGKRVLVDWFWFWFWELGFGNSVGRLVYDGSVVWVGWDGMNVMNGIGLRGRVAVLFYQSAMDIDWNELGSMQVLIHPQPGFVTLIVALVLPTCFSLPRHRGAFTGLAALLLVLLAGGKRIHQSSAQT